MKSPYVNITPVWNYSITRQLLKEQLKASNKASYKHQ
jgi:hypothetical protein